MKAEAAGSIETLVLAYQMTQHCAPEDGDFSKSLSSGKVP
jgi:hypothetical protein